MSVHEAPTPDTSAHAGLLPNIHDVLAALDGPALLTGKRDEICAYNALAGSVLGATEDHRGTGLIQLLRPLSPQAGWLASLDECLSSCEGQAMIPAYLTVLGGRRTATWSVLPLARPGLPRYCLHRMYLHEEEQNDHGAVDFLANVSHDLRTPLTALAATMELVMQDYETMPTEELGKMVSLLHRNTRRLEALVNNLLDAANLQNGKFQLRRSASSAHSLIRDASDFVQPLLSNKNQKLDMRLIGQVPALVVDSKRIIGVLVNLLSNANRYGEPNEPIQLLVSGEDSQVRFTVRQRGPGIPEHEHARLFHRFYRGSTGEGVQGGSGLGLALVKEIVEMHGGTVGLMSKPGSTAFWFTLPVEGSHA